MSRAIDSETASVFSSDEALDLDPRSSDSIRRCLAKVLTLFSVAVVWSVAFVFRDVYSYCSQAVYSDCVPRRTPAEVAAYFGDFYLYDRRSSTTDLPALCSVHSGCSRIESEGTREPGLVFTSKKAEKEHHRKRCIT